VFEHPPESSREEEQEQEELASRIPAIFRQENRQTSEADMQYFDVICGILIFCAYNSLRNDTFDSYIDMYRTNYVKD